MLMRGRHFFHNVVLALMSSVCLLRLPAIGTQAFVCGATSAATTTQRAVGNVMGRTRTSSTSTSTSSTTSRQANRAFSSSARYLISTTPRHSLRPRVQHHRRLAFSSSSFSSASPSAKGGRASSTTDVAVPSQEEEQEEEVGQKPLTAAAGQGFAPKPAAIVASNTDKPAPQRRRQQPKKPQPKAPPRGNNLLVVGLGNPGDKFTMTRHNAGFLVAEELARRHGGMLKIKTAFQGEYCSVAVKGKSVGILRPITFMNNSGVAARKVIDFFKLPMNAALVLVDEVALDFGQLRLKAKGSPGGHNGLKSVQAHLKTPEYTRLRIGVGASNSAALSDHVLGEFTRTERKELDNVVAEACDAVEHWIEEEDMAKVMTRFNSR